MTRKDIEELGSSDSILLGAIGHPDVKPGILEQGILLKLRKEFDQYINLRPVVLYPGVETPLANKKPEDINFTVVRENTEGLYAGAGGYIHYGTKSEVATQESINTYKGLYKEAMEEISALSVNEKPLRDLTEKLMQRDF